MNLVVHVAAIGILAAPVFGRASLILDCYLISMQTLKSKSLQAFKGGFSKGKQWNKNEA